MAKLPESTADMTAEQQEAFIEMLRRSDRYEDKQAPAWERRLVWGGALFFCLAFWAGITWWLW